MTTAPPSGGLAERQGYIETKRQKQRERQTDRHRGTQRPREQEIQRDGTEIHRE